MKRTKVVAIAIILAMWTLACGSGTITALLQTALTTMTAVIQARNPTWSGLSQFQKDGAAALQQVKNWKSGTPAQDVIQILNDVSADVADVPGLSGPDQLVIQIGIGGINSVITSLQNNSPAPSSGATAKVERRTTVQPKYATKSQFAAAWNDAVARDPALASCGKCVVK